MRTSLRNKATQGITAWSKVPVVMELWVRDLDVGSSRPRAASGSKGAAVLCLRRYVSWVKNDVNQFGSYLLRI
jgi:hypothetical protein